MRSFFVILFLVGLELVLLSAPPPAPLPAPPARPSAAPPTPLAVRPLPLPSPSPRPRPSQVAGRGEAADFRRLLRQVEALRELSFKRDVPSYNQTADQVRAYLRRELERDAHWKEDTAFLEQFGFVRRGFDLKATLLDFYTEQVAGYYDYHTAAFYMAPHAMQGDPSMMLLKMAGMGGAVEDSFVVHEMDHAMQDQHFGIKRLEAMTKGTMREDRALAVQSLIEGDAYVVMMLSMLGGMGLPTDTPLSAAMDPDDLSAMGGGAAFNRAPLYLKKMALFPYLQGGLFVDHYKQQGGWAAVNRIYADPPRSTEQVLHPEKYAETPDEPRQVVIPAEPGQAVLAENVMGEARMRFLWDHWLPHEPDRHRASDGWGGDAWRIYGQPGRHYMLWVTVWDDEAAARRFEAAIRTVLRRKAETPDGGPASNGHPGAESPTPVVARRGARVVVVDGAPPARVAPLLDLGWKSTVRVEGRKRGPD